MEQTNTTLVQKVESVRLATDYIRTSGEEEELSDIFCLPKFPLGYKFTVFLRQTTLEV